MTLLGWGVGKQDHSSWLSSTIPFARLRNERLAADEVKKKEKSSSVSFFSFSPPQVSLFFFFLPSPQSSSRLSGDEGGEKQKGCCHVSRETHTSQYSEY